MTIGVFACRIGEAENASSSLGEENDMIQALIFDFDGLILDTETVLYQSWQEIYQEYYCTLALEKWLLRVGGSIDLFDAHIHLGSLIGQSISGKELDRKRINMQRELLSAARP